MALVQEGYDPADHTVDEVLGYFAGTSPEEVARVQAAEAAGKDRKTIADYTVPAPPDHEAENAQRARDVAQGAPGATFGGYVMGENGWELAHNAEEAQLAEHQAELDAAAAGEEG